MAAEAVSARSSKTSLLALTVVTVFEPRDGKMWRTTRYYAQRRASRRTDGILT
jgi:hypothetical protein